MLEAAWRLPPVVADTRVIVRDGWRQMSGWEMDPAPLRPMHRAMLTRSYRLFVARIGGEPVGVGAYALAGTTAYQMGAVVLPSFRKRGV